MQVNAVEQGTRKPGLILGNAARIGLPVTGKAGLACVAAAARVHRRDELKSGWVDNAVIGPRNCHFASFERLAQAIQNLRLEFRYYGATATSDLKAATHLIPKGVSK